MSKQIDRREDINPKEGERKYGDVAFADPVNNKYDAGEVKVIKDRIKRAAKKHGVEIDED